MFNKLFKQKKDFSVSCFNAVQSELDLCRIGDFVNLWYPENETNIHFYRQGTFSGEGLIGQISGSKSRKIIKHLKNGNDINAQIEEMRKGSILIKCIVTTAAELAEKREIKFNEIKKEITKPYNPKSVTYNLFTKTKTDLQINDELDYDESELAIDLNNSEKLEYYRIKVYKLKDHIGDISAQTVVRKLIRAFNSDYLPIIIVSNIETEGKSLKVTLKIGFKNKASA